MSETLVWWLMMQVVGLAALPLCLTLFRRLPDRGYALSKAFGLLLVGYLLWILNILRILPNSTGGIVWVLVLLFAASGYVAWRKRNELVAFWRERWWLIYATELLLFLAFVTAAYLRSYVGDIGGTEKPMDFMFLNAVTRGDHFPPEDPWLTGHNVSYYYFGYLIVSIMTRLSGLETSIGFNLGLSMIVALAATGAFGLVYNLAAPQEQRAAEGGPGAQAAAASKPLLRPIAFGLVAALLLVVMGNLEGVLEWIAAQDMGSSGFWSWVNVKELVPYDSGEWFPDGFWFWWKATRMLDGGVGIHEFPFFSFLLGDLHPHVMSIPFVLLAIGVAMTLFRSDEPLDLVVWLERPFALIGFGLVLGSLAFLNTWDMPTMAFLIAMAALLRNRILAGGWSRGLAVDTAGFVAPLFLVAFLAYTPFFFGGFDSQAAGFTAESGNGSGLFHTFLIWGPFAVLVLPYAAWRIALSGRPVTQREALWALAPVAALFSLWLVWDILGVHLVGEPSGPQGGFGLDRVLGWLPDTIVLNDAHVAGREFDQVSLGERLGRGSNWLTVPVLAAALGLLGLALYREVEAAKARAEERFGPIMALALASTAALLILGVEFVFIEDGFDSRMNTIFKLYYQAWLLLSIAGAFALYELARHLSFPLIRFDRRALWGVAAVVVLLGGLVYPVTATFNRTEDFDLPRSIDGLDYLKRNNPDEYDAIQWLSDLEGQPVIAEALGGDYSEGGRVSAATGLPTLLQWPGHELQWRGTSKPQEGREAALDVLYTSSDPAAVREVIAEYGIRYVFVGVLEREKYPNLTVPQLTDIFEPADPAVGDIVYRVKPEVLSGIIQE